jgi:signal transduction histidine kinase
MSLLDISQYQVLSQDAYQESSKGSQQDLTLGLLKSLSIQIEGKQQVLTICFENYTQVEKRKLNLLTSLLQNTRVNHINAQSHSVADVFNKQLVLIDGFQHQLNLSHSLFSASIEGVAAGILVVDLYGQVLFSNDSLTKLVQQKIDNLAQLIPLVQLHNVNWSELLRDVLIHQQAKHIEARVEDKDLSISVRCVEGLQESQAQEVLLPPLIVLNISDISEIKQAHRSRNEMIDFLSHDLRSPMASLQALVSQARTGQLVELDVVHLLDKVDHYSQRGLNFAEQFLDLAKLEGEQDIPLYEVDLYSIAQNALDTVYHQAQEKAIRLTLQADDDVWTYSNGELLERVLLNLLTNAVKYSPKHSEIWIKVMAFNNTVQLGISAELAPVLFKPYARGKDSNTQQAKGVGLGLRFVDVALKRLQSQIQFDCASKEDINPGTRFYFQLEKLDFS